ncbi:hypothetical protein ES708_13893 [subsurface metagenome]
MNSESVASPGVQGNLVNAPELPVSNRTTNLASGAIGNNKWEIGAKENIEYRIMNFETSNQLCPP